MVLRTLLAGVGGLITGTGTVAVPSGIVGGINISADGTNAAVVVLRKNDASGEIIFSQSTKSPMLAVAPFNAAQTVYYSVSGTGASAQFFEWVE